MGNNGVWPVGYSKEVYTVLLLLRATRSWSAFSRDVRQEGGGSKGNGFHLRRTVDWNKRKGDLKKRESTLRCEEHLWQRVPVNGRVVSVK